MLHLQKPVDRWLESVARLPAGSCVLAVDQVQEAPAVKAANPGVTFALRHHYDTGQQADGNWEQQLQRSREFFASFVDGTFAEFATHVDYILGFNEFYADSQNRIERDQWTSQVRAHCEVWTTEYRTIPAFSHIRLVIANTAVGNDIPIECARLYWDYHPAVVIGYHPYSHWHMDGGIPIRAANDWADLSGRWARMEAAWRFSVEWLFTEAGPFESAVTGWRSPECLGHSVTAYVNAVREWIRDCATTPAYQEGRLRGFALFTTGRAGPVWSGFWTEQPELNALADMVAQEWEPGSSPPPPPPIDRGQPRVQYGRTLRVIPQGYTQDQAHAVLDEAWENRNTIGFSYDDAGIGDLDRRTAILYGVPAGEEQQAMEAWYEEHYTGTVVEFADVLPEPPEEPGIIDIVDDLPQDPDHDYPTRLLTDITTLVIHHTTGDPFQPIENIASYHVNTKGWPGIGYHYVIDGAGTIFQTNYLVTKSYHVGTLNAPGDENLWSVGIALQGHFGPWPPPPEPDTADPPPQVQQDAARALVQYLKGQLFIDYVLGHRESQGAQTACPGSTFEEWLPFVRYD